MKKNVKNGIDFYQFSIFEPNEREIFHGIFPRVNSRTGKSFNIHYDFGSEDEVNENRRMIAEAAEMMRDSRSGALAPRSARRSLPVGNDKRKGSRLPVGNDKRKGSRLPVDDDKGKISQLHPIFPENDKNDHSLSARGDVFAIISAEQTHSKNVRTIFSPNQISKKNHPSPTLSWTYTLGHGLMKKYDEISDTDAIITPTLGLGLMVKTADCQPILIYDPVRKVVANVHSGWRGTVQNIIGETVQRMISEFGSRPDDLRIGIGPSLGPCCSEFDNRTNDFKGFEKYFLPNYHVDLWEITREQLLEIGVLRGNIEFSEICTKCRKDKFFSYRRDKPDQGRFGSVIGLL